MTAAVAYPHITKPFGEPAHLERVPRVRVSQIVMDYLAHGWSPDEMCRHHPYLQLAEAHAAMAYYYDHQDEIDQEIRREVEEVERLREMAERNRMSGRIGSNIYRSEVSIALILRNGCRSLKFAAGH